MVDDHRNFAYSTVATAPSPASSGTSLVVASGAGAVFPTPPFNATVWPVGAMPLNGNAEIVRVTAISTDTLTITRAQEGTSARTVVVGDQVAATITDKTLTDIEAGMGGGSSVFAGDVIARDGSGAEMLMGEREPASGQPGLVFGGSVNLYAFSGKLITDDDFQTNGTLYCVGDMSTGGYVFAKASTANQVTLGFSGAGVGPAMTFGSAHDTNLYRADVSLLATDDTVRIGSGVTTPTMTGVALLLANLSSAPSTNPTGGGVIYCEGGALKYRGSSGTVTTLAPA